MTTKTGGLLELGRSLGQWRGPFLAVSCPGCGCSNSSLTCGPGAIGIHGVSGPWRMTRIRAKARVAWTFGRSASLSGDPDCIPGERIDAAGALDPLARLATPAREAQELLSDAGRAGEYLPMVRPSRSSRR